MKKTSLIFLLSFLFATISFAQTEMPASENAKLYEIAGAPSAERIEADIRTLAGFGTRHTLSDTLSEIRGIGAARRWIKAEFEKISAACGNCLDVYEHRTFLPAGDRRITKDVWIVNVVAVLKGASHPNRYVMMSGDIDSRVTDPNDFTSDSPGANDNASGMAGVLESARILSKYQFENSIAFVGLSGEEQGLYGGKYLAATADSLDWEITGVLNNDMIGNIHGLDGVIDNQTFRIFSEGTPVTEAEDARRRRRFYGGEVDGVSRQLARYVARVTEKYLPKMKPMLIYRLDRFGRGGHHRPFNDAGFAGIRIMEAHENYTRQHQDLRTEDGIEYGDVVAGVNFEYAANLTAVNSLAMAALAWAPPAPEVVKIGGVVEPSTRLAWTGADDENLAGYKVYWRLTTAPQWTNSRFVGKVDAWTLENIIIDNYLFGVASVDIYGNESVVVFPSEVMR